MLVVKNVTKTFGNIVALSEISFEVDKGEFLFITGPSGSGKTTLLRLLMREYLPDSGEIIFDKKEMSKLKRKEIPLHRQQIGVVFQDFKLIPERTVRENVEVALAVIGLDENKWEERVDEILDIVGLTQRNNLFPRQLSGGELQRLSLARALAVDPLMILADEPTGNLDWDTADEVMKLLLEINKQGKTIIMATHHRLIVDKYKKRVIELKSLKKDNKDKGKTKVKKGKKEK